MNKNIAIKVEKLSKLYRLGELGTGSLGHDINRFLAKVRGKEDPYSIIGQTNDRTTKAKSDYVWALKDINFEVKQGEVLGIIGKNGAGKSTLLKLISQITSPTKGSIKAKGRIASLLEVGTGMHPEMTARENIFLNGAILGMNKKEIKSKFDEIIDFAGCQLYIDTPLKRFSSGMRVRLGFAVAAFLEPEILIVDEVLAVGDAEFQNKAIGKMKEVSEGGRRTVLFVSHNMNSVRALCNKGIVLNNGSIDYEGDINSCISKYLSFSEGQKVIETIKSGGLLINNLQILSESNKNISSGNDCKITFHITNTTSADFKNLRIVCDIVNEKGVQLFRLINQNDIQFFNLEKKTQQVSCTIKQLPLNEGKYFLSLRVRHGEQFLIEMDNVITFEVHAGDFFGNGKIDKHSGNVLVKSEWKYD